MLSESLCSNLELFLQGGFLVLDDKAEIHHASEACSGVFGIRYATSMIGRNFLDLIEDASRPQLESLIAKARRSTTPLPGTFSIIDATGASVAIQCRLARAPGSSLQLMVHCQRREMSRFRSLNHRLSQLNREVSRRRKAELSLRRSQQRLESILASTPEGILGLTREGMCTFSNDSALTMLGYDSPQELVGTLIQQHVDTKAYEEVRLQLEREEGALGSESDDSSRQVGIRTSFINKKGDHVQVEYRVGVLADELGATGFILTFRDIGEQLLAEERERVLSERAQQTQKLESLGVLAGGIAHDFNNLLLGMMGNIDLAKREAPGSERLGEFLADAMSAADVAAGLCRQMLAYSGRGQFLVEPVQLGSLVEEMTQLVRSAISKKVELELELDADPDLPAIEADRNQMRQVVMNLVINASDAIGDEEGRVTIRTGVRECRDVDLLDSYTNEDLAPGSYVYLEVRDTGAGMTMESTERIFEPFFTTKSEGRGLGLAAVLGIVRGHKGALKIDSSPGAGTTMTILLPASEKRSRPRKSERARGKKKVMDGTVLVVDDEVTLAKLAKRILSAAGLEVLLAKDGIEAIDMYRHRGQDIDAVLLDMTMPRLSGEETLRELHRIDDKVCVVLTSGYNAKEEVSQLTSGGLAGFIQKPYRASELVAMFEDILSPCDSGTR